MKRLLASLVLAAVIGGCGGSGSGAGPVPPPSPLPNIGYGLVNGWHRTDARALAEGLVDAGLGLTALEWAPWEDSPEPGCSPPSSSRTFPLEAAGFVAAMRARGITTIINVINANGCAQRRQRDAYVTDAVDFIVREIGPDHVVLSGVSEPWADPEHARRWTELARQLWDGLFILPDAGANHPRRQPYWAGIPYDLLDTHYCDDAALLAALAAADPTALANTDCGTIVNPGPDRARRFAAAAAASGNQLLIYDFKGRSPDWATIAAMGAAIKGEELHGIIREERR